MKSFRPWTLGLAALCLAILAAAAPAAARTANGGAHGGSAHGGSAHGGTASWRVHTVLRERIGGRITSQVVDPRAGVDYAMVARTVSLSGPYRLRRTDLATGSVRSGPEFRTSGLSLAAGYLWIYGNLPPQSPSLRLVLSQVNPRTLAVVRFWRLTPRRRGVSDIVKIAAGPEHTVWAGFQRTVLRIRVSTGATIGRIRLPRGTFFSDVATIAAHRRLYIAASGVKSGGADVREYTAGGGRLITSTGRHPLPSVGGANLTAVPGGVWASFRTGMLGQTVLLRRNGLTSVPLSGSIFGWPMNASTVYGGGALWLANGSNAIGCIAPDTGVVRHQRTLAQLGMIGELLAVNGVSHVIYGLGVHGVIAITAPRGCWA
jgi:hypothetical protein